VLGAVGAAAFFVFKRVQERESRAAGSPAAAAAAPAADPAATPTAVAPAPASTAGEAPPDKPVEEAAAPPPTPVADTRPEGRPEGTPEASAKVVLEVQGVPQGTEVIGPDGKVLGKAPGKIDVDRGETPLKLQFRAKGYKPETAVVTPKADGILTVALEKKATSRPKATRSDGDEGKKKPGKDDIEDAF